MAKKENWCCWGNAKGKFPTFAVIILIIGVWWLLNELGIVKTNVPWFPIILIVLAIGWIIDSIKKR